MAGPGEQLPRERHFGRRRSDTLDVMSGIGDERAKLLYTRAVAFAGTVMSFVLPVWWLVQRNQIVGYALVASIIASILALASASLVLSLTRTRMWRALNSVTGAAAPSSSPHGASTTLSVFAAASLLCAGLRGAPRLMSPSRGPIRAPQGDPHAATRPGYSRVCQS